MIKIVINDIPPSNNKYNVTLVLSADCDKKEPRTEIQIRSV